MDNIKPDIEEDCILDNGIIQRELDELLIPIEEYLKHKEKIKNDNELCTSYGRIILRNLDGSVIVRPEAPDNIKIGGAYYQLSNFGKKRWNEGLNINYQECFDSYISKDVIEADFK